MFAISCARGLRVPLKDFNFVASTQKAVLVKACSSSVCKNDSQKTFTVSYLINSCGLPSKDAISVSDKVCLKSIEKPDAVLRLLREYGFTNAHILRIVSKWPGVLAAKPNKNLLPKLEFFLSMGVPRPVLVRNLSACPAILMRSLENAIIPFYGALKSLLESDERVVSVFSRVPVAFTWSWSEGFNSNIAMLRERGVSESSIVTLVLCQPYVLIIGKEKLAAYVDRAVEMGFDITKGAFLNAIRVFVAVKESNMKHKMDVYKRCGWSESDIIAAFLKYPICLTLSEKNIMATMDFLVDKLGCEPAAIAQCPLILGYSLEKRIKPRSLVAGILKERGLKNIPSVNNFLILPEKLFLRTYIAKYEKDIPDLLDIYRGKLSRHEMCFQLRNIF